MVEKFDWRLLSNREIEQVPFVPRFENMDADLGAMHALPVEGRVNILLPCSPGWNHNFCVNGISAIELLNCFIASQIDREKFLFSTPTHSKLCFRLERFSCDLASNINEFCTSFILFDKTNRIQVCFDGDVWLTMISLPSDWKSEFLGHDIAYWHDTFSNSYNSDDGWGNDTIDFVNQNWVSRIPGMSPVPYRTG